MVRYYGLLLKARIEVTERAARYKPPLFYTLYDAKEGKTTRNSFACRKGTLF